MDATTFAALGEPSRLQIVELMRERPFAVGEIVDRLSMRQPQVSKHLRVLRNAGIVDVEAVARHRIYHLQDEPFARIGSWLESFERLWEARLGSVDTVLDGRGGSTGSVDQRENGT